MKVTHDIGSKLELFVDDWLFEETHNITLRLHQPVPMETLVDFDQPGETTQSTVAVSYTHLTLPTNREV